MGRTVQMQIRLEPDLKSQSEEVLNQLGLKPTEYIRMALRQLVMRRGLPFDARIPNAETIKALDEPAEQLRHFPSAHAVFSDLEVAEDARRKDQ